MKKVYKFLSLIIISYVALNCLSGCSKSSNIKEITFKELKQKIENKESFALYVGNKNCSHCEAYKPTLESVLDEYNITIYHLDNSKLTEKEQNELPKYLSISGTPTVAFIENGDEESTLNRIV